MFDFPADYTKDLSFEGAILEEVEECVNQKDKVGLSIKIDRKHANSFGKYIYGDK